MSTRTIRTIRSLVLSALVAIAAPIGAAHALELDTWSIDELQASDDTINLQFGIHSGNTTLTLQWVGGVADTPGALGIDKFFINNSNSALEVMSVYADDILLSNDVTSAWLPTNGGTSAGGSFGSFTEKLMEASGDGGIAPGSLIFVLNGLYDESSFISNSQGATFAAHVRYGNGCSGWVAHGGTPGDGGSDSSCGVTPIPEPSAALVFSVGAIVVAGALRRRR